MRTITIFLALALAACGSSNSTPKDAAVADAPADAAVTGPDASCFNNPQSYNEIINACTNAQKIYITSRPPLEGSDGSLPPLP